MREPEVIETTWGPVAVDGGGVDRGALLRELVGRLKLLTVTEYAYFRGYVDGYDHHGQPSDCRDEDYSRGFRDGLARGDGPLRSEADN